MVQAPKQPVSADAAASDWGVVDELKGMGLNMPAGAEQVAESVSADAGFAPRWPGRGELLDACAATDGVLAAVLLVAGVGYLFVGYMLFKLLVVVNVAGLGAWGGWWLGERFGHPVAGTAVGGVVAAAVAWPAMRYAVAFCAAVVGFTAGVAVWRSAGLLDAYAPAGGLVGAVFLAMLSFVGFKLSIIAFTSVQGGILLLGGVLSLALKYDALGEPTRRFCEDQPLALPLALLVVSLAGVLFQQHSYRNEGKPG